MGDSFSFANPQSRRGGLDHEQTSKFSDPDLASPGAAPFAIPSTAPFADPHVNQMRAEMQRMISGSNPGASALYTGGARRKRRQRKSELQRQMTVGSANDPLEKEADAVADRVMRNTHRFYLDPRVSGKAGEGMQRETDMQDEEESLGNTTSMQMDREDAASPEGGTVSPDLQRRIEGVRNSGGQQLPNSEREFFESRMDRDFGDVRIHTGSEAAQVSREVNAKAFTIGRDVVFGEGQYKPGTDEGRRLMAHELTHTVQQGAAGHIKRQTEFEPIYSYKALTAHDDRGWLFVRLESGQLANIAKNTRVQYLGYTDNGRREKFRILDWPHRNKVATVKAISSTQSRFEVLPFSGPAKLVFEKSNKRLKVADMPWVSAYTMAGDPIPVGTHKIWLPDYLHKDGLRYLQDSPLASIWFRLGEESSDRYLHIGRVSLGCITVGAQGTVGAAEARKKWTEICLYLLSRRAGHDSVGEVVVQP